MKSLLLGHCLEITFPNNVLKIQIEEYRRILKFGSVLYVIVIFHLEEFYKNIEKLNMKANLKVFMGIIQKLMLFVNSVAKFVHVSVI